jgi:transposase
MVEQVVVGIDVSKAKLEVAILPNGEQFTVSNDRHGMGELLTRLSPLAPSRVVL